MPCLICGAKTGGKARCPKHQAEFEAPRRARKAAKNRASGRTTQHWKRCAAQVRKRSGGRCEIKHLDCLGQATTVHLLPEYGTDHSIARPEWCLDACLRCHGRVSGFGHQDVTPPGARIPGDPYGVAGGGSSTDPRGAAYPALGSDFEPTDLRDDPDDDGPLIR